MRRPPIAALDARVAIQRRLVLALLDTVMLQVHAVEVVLDQIDEEKTANDA